MQSKYVYIPSVTHKKEELYAARNNNIWVHNCITHEANIRFMIDAILRLAKRANVRLVVTIQLEKNFTAAADSNDFIIIPELKILRLIFAFRFCFLKMSV